MLTLANALLGIVFLSGLLWAVGFRLRGRAFPLGLQLFGLGVGVVLIMAVGQYLGFGRTGSPLIPRDQLQRLRHLGYYTTASSHFVIRGKQEDGQPVDGSGFAHGALGPEEKVLITPIRQERNITGYRFQATAYSRPLRVDGRCRNVPDEAWLKPGEGVLIQKAPDTARATGAGERNGPRPNEKATRYVAITWTREETGPFYRRRKQDVFRYQQGEVQQGRLAPDAGQPVVIARRTLNEGLRLADLLEATPAFHELWRKASGDKPLEIGHPAYADALNEVMLVRQKLKDTDTPLGVMLGQSLRDDPSLRVLKTRPGSTGSSLAVAGGLETLEIPFGKGTDPMLVAYGLGARDTLALQLPRKAELDAQLGEVLDLRFPTPQVWPLPPTGKPRDNFILTSSRDYIPMDGYVVETGSVRHAFYAKGTVKPAEGKLEVRDGVSVQSARLGDPLRLGDDRQGVTIDLYEREPAVPYVGPAAALLLALWTAVFCWLIGRERPDGPSFAASHPPRRPQNLAWAQIWACALALLVVRLILAYRSSLVPPDDATAIQLADVFQKALSTSVNAFVAIPTLMLLVRWCSDAGRLPRPRWLQSRRRGNTPPRRPFPITLRPGGAIPRWMVYTVAAAPPLWAILGRFLGRNEALFGVRISHATHMLMVLAICVLVRSAVISKDKLARNLLVGTVLFSSALLIVLVQDMGSTIYLLSLLLVLSGLSLWKQEVANPWHAFKGAWPVIVVAAGVLVGPSVLQMVGVPLIHRIWVPAGTKDPKPPAALYRLTSFAEAKEGVLMLGSEDTAVKMDLLLRNSHQTWQMLLYAAEGSRQPKGYGQAPQTDRGMTYGTALVDCAYATQLMPEHGPRAAMLVLAMYLLLGAACIIGSWFLPYGSQHRLFPLLAIGGFFACNALYMAAANLGLVLFTGQNMPLLGIYSAGDAAQCGVLLALATWLLRAGLPDEGESLRLTRPALFGLGAFFLLGLVAIGAWASYAGFHMPTRYRDDHDVSNAVFKKIRERLPNTEGDARHSDGLKLEGGRLITLPGTTLSQIEKQYLDRFNESPNKTEAVRSFYYLEELSGRNEAETEPRYAVRVNRSFFRLQSPYREIPAWEGLITASGQVEEPTFNVLGRRVSLSLKQDGDARTMTIDGRDSLREHSKLLILARTPGSPAMCELSRVGQDVELRSKQGDWKVQVNGREAGYERVADRLRPNDILALTDPNGRRLSLLYLGVKPSVLAFTQWRNGRKKRVFPEGGVFALADTMGKAADRTIQLQDEAKRRLHRVADEDRPFTEALVKAPTLPTDKSLALSLDLSLHRGLQEYTESWMGSRAMRGARIRPRRLAITLMDAFSGEVVAMPSWPAEDPGDPDRDRKLRELSPRQRALLTGNHNLVNHAIGSTVKPVLLATTATQFWPSGKDLGKLTIYGRTTEQTHLGGLELQKSYSPPEGIRTAEMGPFLSQSYDWPACMLGILGMLTRPEDLSTAWVPATSNYDIRYQGKGYKVDMWKPEATPFIGQDRRAPRVGVQYADQGLLFTGLEKLFDATRSPTEKELTALELQRLQQFYPTLAPYTALNEQVDQNDYLDDILPVPVVISPRDFQTIRGDLISLFIGGGNCRWNNVLMAQAAARLATGRRVTATFERRPGGEFPPMPDPLGKSAWRKEHLEQPMIRAGQVGTARSLRSAAGRGDVVVMFKTGTINEAKPDRDSETLMFIVGVQRNGEFVRGATVAGYLYMQDASSKDRGDMRKFDFARPVLREVGRYVREHAAAMKASGASTGAGAP